jgi:hypothetical protein
MFVFAVLDSAAYSLGTIKTCSESFDWLRTGFVEVMIVAHGFLTINDKLNCRPGGAKHTGERLSEETN